uniref:Uncharacterized protein n=1 Tax=Heterorhabditis bacteriophora TaxID=37862 RepID=A0A1I7WRM7_HETBA
MAFSESSFIACIESWIAKWRPCWQNMTESCILLLF